jgi:hypothetical protein
MSVFAMDEQSKNIIKRKLQKLGDMRLGKEHLKELREEIAQGTGHNKFAPFKNIRKWVAMVKKEMKKEPALKKERAPAPEKKAVDEPVAAISDRVFLQTIGYEVAGIRRTMDRISSQLTEIEKKLSSKKE